MFFIVLCLSVLCTVNVSCQKHFCADMKPQNSVDVEQLMGIWYGIEILSHKPNEEGIVEYYDSCPIIFLSEIEEPTTVAAHGYGADYGYDGQDYYGRTFITKLSSTTARPTTLYDQHLYGKGTYAANSPYLHRHLVKEKLRRLRLLWDESGNNIEYTLKFNASRAGFWISSGPQNGSMLQKQYDQFAGTVQVMKAVGNHMVLTFCHQLPDRQLFSILLSRTPYLSYQEIQGVHNLLNRRNLTFGNIRKVCNSSTSIQNNLCLSIVLVFSLLWYRIMSTHC